MLPGLTTVYNCPQFTNQSVGSGDRFFERMRVISTTISLQSKYRPLSNIQI